MAADRQQLLHWIDETRRNQKILGVIVVALVAAGFLLRLWRHDVGNLVLAATAILAVCGFWITASHIADFRARLETHGDQSAGS